MATSKELYLALLALDSYNHGYNSGLRLETTRLGNTQLTRDADNEAAQSIGFYATAYDVSQVAGLGGAHTVVSYRGTDFISP